ncbi:MAG: hypothetical protein HYZ43_08705 [Flavobacteriia bacterium]|nr:hypothetical protein [Flavobacteriia bacterium]
MGDFNSGYPSRGVARDNYSSVGPASWIIVVVFLLFVGYIAIRVWISLRIDKKRERLEEIEVREFAKKIKRRKKS